MEFIDLKKQYRNLKEKIDAAVLTVMERGNYIAGEEVSHLQGKLAEYCGRKHCLTCANGTDALTIALRCLKVGSGDAVFVPSFTFFASAETVAMSGAQCIFVDIDEATFNISPEMLARAVEQVIAEGKLFPKCIVSVDLFGLPADYYGLKKVAEKYGLSILEDAAQGFGGSIRERKACSFGDISTTSFFPAKPLGCFGDGGAIFTDNDEYYAEMSSLAVHGKGAYKYDNVRLGYNSRLDTIQAAILLQKLAAFQDYELKKRNEIASIYSEQLHNRYCVPYVPEGFESSWAQFTLTLSSEEERTVVQEYLKSQGVPTMIYYPIPMHKQTAFSEYSFHRENLLTSERLSKTVLSIPMHPYLEIKDIDKIVESLYNVK